MALKREDRMSAKVGLFYALALNIVWGLAAHAEEPEGHSAMVPPGEPAAATMGDVGPGPGIITAGHLSSWITYTRPDCCAPIGADGPITYDIYVRTGPTLPVGGGILGSNLATGWEVEGGGRSLFFNVPQTAAWVVDLGLSFHYNHSAHSNQVFQINGTPQTINQLHRTFVNVGLGREWYLLGAANSCDTKWIVGLDGGGRYGTARLELHAATPTTPATHIADVPGGAYVALHTEVEIPCGCCKFEYGFRAEWDYTFMDILPQDSDLQDVNFLMTAGVRF
jgi:hypothetical protein